MENKKKNILLLTVMFFLFSCSKRELTIEEYKEFMSEPSNGLTIEKKMGNLIYCLTYLSPEILAFDEINGMGSSLSEQQKDSIIESYQGAFYFFFEIKSNNGSSVLHYRLNSPEEETARISFFSFEFRENIRCYADKKEYKCTVFNFNRTYNLNPSLQFLIGFERTSFEEALNIKIEDKIFGNGILKFNFNKQTISNIPQIIL
jgi:hypothetical protein